MRSWSELTNREKLMIITLSVVAVSFFFFWFLYKPKADAVTKINNKLDTTMSQIRNNKDVLRRKEELKKEYQKIIAKLNKDKSDNPISLSRKSELIVNLNQLIDSAGVTLEKLEAKKSQNTKEGKYDYKKLPIEIEVTGKYNNILNFVNEIEKIEYLIKIDNLNLNSNLSSDISSDQMAQIKARIKLVAFATDDKQEVK